MGLKSNFNVPPGVAGGVNAGDSNESGRAGVCSPAANPSTLKSSDCPSDLLRSVRGASFGEAWAGRSVIATAERRGIRGV